MNPRLAPNDKTIVVRCLPPEAPTIVTPTRAVLVARPDAPTMVKPTRAAKATPPPIPTRALAARLDAPTTVKPARALAAAADVPTIARPAATHVVVERVGAKTTPAVDKPGATMRTSAGSPDVFALIRRIAIQRDLADAAAVLHAGLAGLVGGRVALVQIDANGAMSSPVTGDLRDATALVKLEFVAEVSKRRQRYVADRVVIVPLPTVSRAVLVAWRAPEAAAFDAKAIELVSHAALRLGVLDHFLAGAAEKQAQKTADGKSMFRAEALAAARETRKDGQLVDLSPRILRIAIPSILLVAGILVTLAAIIQVPSYSRGTVIVKANGHNVIASSGGRIAKILVTPGQQVLAGDPLIELDTTQERQTFSLIDTNYRDQLSTFLFDTTDEAARASLAGILAQRTAAREALAAKTITAPIDGSVSDVLVTDLVMGGEHVATIIPADSAPSVLAFMEGSDRSRLAPGMQMQVELTGYPGSRLELTITEVGTDIMGQAKARKLLGEKLADSVAMPASVVLVKAALPAGFESRGKTYNFFDGMTGLAEIEIDRRSFLSVVIPTGD